MRHQKHLTILLLAGLAVTASVCLGDASSALASVTPLAVSPGDASKAGVVGARCPTFSWSGVAGATGYELVLYKLGEDDTEEEGPVLQRSFSGSVESWTPSLEDCPERGERYAWSVRALSGDEASEWSAAGLFEVASGPSKAEIEEALQVVRQHQRPTTSGVVAQGTAPSPEVASMVYGTGPVGSASLGPTLQSLTVGDSALMVNGSAVVTTATLGALGLARVPQTGQNACYDAAGTTVTCGTGIGLAQDGDLQLGVTWPSPRFTDNGNGTVTDNLTGLIWLANADCAQAEMDWAAALAFANTLFDGSVAHNGGDCGLSDDSEVGAWRLPNVRELQSTLNYGRAGHPLPPFGEPVPFQNVLEQGYWSSTTVDEAFVRSRAYLVHLGAGTVFSRSKTETWPVWVVRDEP